MIHEKKVSFGAGYIRKKAYEYDGVKYEADIKDGDIIKIVSEGQQVIKEFKGNQVASTVTKVETRNGVKVITLNQTSVNNLVDAYGKDDKEWIGKEAKVWIIRAMISNKMQDIAYLSHPKAEMSEDSEGRIIFLTPEKSDVKISSDEIEKEDDDINWDDLDQK